MKSQLEFLKSAKNEIETMRKACGTNGRVPGQTLRRSAKLRREFRSLDRAGQLGWVKNETVYGWSFTGFYGFSVHSGNRIPVIGCSVRVS